MDKYRDRQEAGIILADQLKAYANRSDVIVLALPRGGVPVAFEIAQALAAPLDVFIVRKLGTPGQEELAMGAVAMGGAIVFNEDVIKHLAIPKNAIDQVIQAEQKELHRRVLTYRGDESLPDLAGKVVLLVDDGIATGASMRAAVLALHKFKPTSIIIAVPVAEKTTCETFTKMVDKVICPLKPVHFYAVGQWYQNFSQTTDDEVRLLLKKAKQTLKGALT